MHSLTRTIRDHINQPRINHRIRQSIGHWNLLTSSLDVLEDAELAIAAYGRVGATMATGDEGGHYQLIAGVQYLTTYGLLQAFFIQQDAVFHVSEALGMTHEMKNYPKLEAIRGVRNISIGHPTKVDRPKSAPVSHHFISRMTMSPMGFQLLSFSDDNTTSSRDVSIPDMIADQTAELSGILTEVIEELSRQEAAHVAEFEGERLSDTLPQTLSYCFEKISSDLYGSGPTQVGLWGIETISTAVSDFREALNRRGFVVGVSEFVDFVFDELAYPIDQIQRYLRQEPHDIHNVQTARIFTSYILSKVDELKRMAVEIDESYGAS